MKDSKSTEKKEQGFTPGPWIPNFTWLDGGIVRWHIASKKNGSVYPVCEHVIERGDMDIRDSCPSADEQINNAHLIAAAPLMFAALEKIIEAEFAGKFPVECESTYWGEARRALAAAKGEAK